MNFDNFAVFAVVWFFAWAVAIAKRYYQEFWVGWTEPVLRYPVLIFESDDWGAGSLKQADALTRIIATLNRYSDQYGHPPVMTLGVVLSISDRDRIKKAEFKSYFAQRLDHPIFSPVRMAMLSGLNQGVFDLQLHGMAHYWPENLMQALQTDNYARIWLDREDYPETETLSPMLQSRWTNSRQSPTIALTEDEIKRAVFEEVNVFSECFGFKPKVAVPPTFIWNQVVERSWRQHSVEYLVTPGQYFDHRDREGNPSGPKQKIANGQLSDSGLIYIVRNDYFEPSLGHTANMAFKELLKKTELYQPALLEIHRFNFIGDDETVKNSLSQLEKIINLALAEYPNLMFLSTRELAEKYRNKSAHLVERSYFFRLLVFSKRIWTNSSIRKWLYLSGLFLPFLCLVYFINLYGIKKHIGNH